AEPCGNERTQTLPIVSLPRFAKPLSGPRPGVLDRFGRGRRDRHLVEAGERLVLPIGVEVLETRDAAVGSEGPQLKELALEGAAADALDAGKRPPPEEHIALQAEDFVFGERGIVGEIEPGAVVLEERCGSSRGPGSQDPAIDGLYVGSVCRGVAIGIEGPGI